MSWKSREDKMPPPSFFSMAVAYLQRAYPGAQISRELMLTLRPFLIEAWRNGRSAEAAAQTTCSCDGRHIVPSPVVAVHIAKGSVRPPKGAQRGEVFGADALRPPSRIERMQRQLDRVSREEQKKNSEVSRWAQRAQRARTDSTRHEAEQKQAQVTAKRADLLAEAKRMEAELERLRQELNRPAMKRPMTQGAPPAGVPDQAASPAPTHEVAQSAPFRSPEARSKPQERRGRGRPRGTTAKAQPPATSDASVESQSAAMFKAMQGMLPNLATTLAAQMAKEGDAK